MEGADHIKTEVALTEAKNNEFTCNNCGNSVAEDDDFCPHCGNLFAEGLRCKKHYSQQAAGVCIICAEPYCNTCAGWINDNFLCANHEEYEIYQGMARVFGSNNEPLVQYVQKCLAESGLHPFLYSRKASPISIGGPSYTLFRASGEFDGHIINELKLMVPCQEVIEAEELLRQLKII